MSVNIVDRNTGNITKVAGNPIEQASGISYDHTSSGMQASNVQAAVDELKSGLTTLDNEVNGDATTYPYADVITIEDAIPANLAECKVKIEPVQDLHGFDHPWVGGANVNLLPSLVPGTYEKDGIIVTVDNNGNMNISGTKTASSAVTINVPLTSPIDISANYYLHIRNDVSDSNVVTMGITFSGTNRIAVMNDMQGVQNCVVYIASVATLNINARLSIEKTNNVTDWSPYENICPITGHTEASVLDEGKNLVSAIEQGGFGNDGADSSATNRLRSDGYISVIGGSKYTVSNSASLQTAVFYWDEQDVTTPYQSSGWQNSPYTFEVPANAKYVRIMLRKSDNSDLTPSDTDNIQIEYGEAATAYTPYVAPHTYTIALGDTIYGGIVDFDSSMMTVDSAFVEYDGSNDEAWTYDSNAQYIYITPSTAGKIPADINTKWNAIANYLTANKFNELYVNHVAGCGMSASGNIAVHISGVTDITTDIATIRTYLSNNPLQLCYELATPTTIQLTPQQIQLLKGQNTLYASTGQISVTVNGVSGSIGQVQEQVNELAEDVALKQNATDNNLATNNKTIVGGINELKSGLNDVNSKTNADLMVIEMNGSGGQYYNYTFTHPTTVNRAMFMIMRGNQSGETKLSTCMYLSDFAASASVVSNDTAITSSMVDGNLVLTVDAGASAWVKPIILMHRYMFDRIK